VLCIWRRDRAFLVKDKEHPYIQEKPFDWIRAYQVGGKSLLWARQVQRWSKFDFDAPRRESYATEWPITYDDMAPWYSHVEKFAGISGNKDGLENLPDGEFLPPWEMNVVEKHLWNNSKLIILTDPLSLAVVLILHNPRKYIYNKEEHNARQEVCVNVVVHLVGYFSSNASTIPWHKRQAILL
jgi:choline dehydrogenase-like flavoprotein